MDNEGGMAILKPKTIWNIIMLSGDVWGAWSWVSRSGWLEKKVSVGSLEYAAIITFFTGMLIALNWDWIKNRFFPHLRFYELHPKIVEAIKMMEDDNTGRGTREDVVISRSTWAKAIEIAQELRALRVPYPNVALVESVHWWDWLPLLSGFVATKNLKAARGDKNWEKYQKRGKWVIKD